MNGLYAVGKRYSEFQTGLEGGQIGFDGSWTMVLNLPQMTKKEAESIRFGSSANIICGCARPTLLPGKVRGYAFG